MKTKRWNPIRRHHTASDRNLIQGATPVPPAQSLEEEIRQLVNRTENGKLIIREVFLDTPRSKTGAWKNKKARKMRQINAIFQTLVIQGRLIRSDVYNPHEWHPKSWMVIHQ